MNTDNSSTKSAEDELFDYLLWYKEDEFMKKLSVLNKQEDVKKHTLTEASTNENRSIQSSI